MDLVLLTVRLFLFGVFMLAGIGKLLDLEGAEKAIREFGAPEKLSKGLAGTLPFVEIAIAVLLLFVETSWYGAVGASLLLFGFVSAMVRQISLGKAPDCHCFGQIHSEPVGTKSLVRNAAIALLAILLVLAGRGSQGRPLSESSNLMQTVVILVVAAISVVAVIYLKKIFEQQTRILRRLEILELISNEGGSLEREDAGNPHDGLPIGSPFPEFNLPNLAGQQVSLSHLLAAAKPVLFLFVSPTCGPCASLLPEFEKWRREMEGEVAVLLLSSGSIEANAEKFAGIFKGEILLQEKREVADLVRARWTPTALLVRRDGAIASYLAAGDTSMRELVARIQSENPSGEHFFVTNGESVPAELKIGERVPPFSLKSVNGTEVTSDFFKKRKTLVIFWMRGCPACASMQSDLERWDSSRSDADPGLLVFSNEDGDGGVGISLRSPVVIDQGYETAKKLGMSGTPSAIVVNDEGRIVTETAVGAPNIWALIGRQY